VLAKKPVRSYGSKLRHTLLLVLEAKEKAYYGLYLDVLTNRTQYKSVKYLEYTNDADILGNGRL
jgi:hypothetical protein